MINELLRKLGKRDRIQDTMLSYTERRKKPLNCYRRLKRCFFRFVRTRIVILIIAEFHIQEKQQYNEEQTETTAIQSTNNFTNCIDYL
jgi:hypothetical protein